MDFFTHQERARKQTGLLVVYFLVAVALIVAAVHVAVTAILLGIQSQTDRMSLAETLQNPRLLLWITGTTVLLITIGSIYKIRELRSGGATVARMLGGRPVAPNTLDLDERVLLNVVEEMAIASGAAVPPVFVLDQERGINAFAAGFTPEDAVVVVTRGALETLSRDELQGVIAHEFSHVLNGDMRLNIRLMGVLHGILLIALVGYWILRMVGNVSSDSDDDGKGKAGLIVTALALGAALIAIGGIGVFFGKLIKSAVSRQREFLADASAVQFTRNPPGIGGALRKIGGCAQGSRVLNHHAESASHMFFGRALKASALGLMDTHPPLAERIRRIDPTFDGTFPAAGRVTRTAGDVVPQGRAAAPAGPTAAVRGGSAGLTRAEAGAAAFAFQPGAAVDSVGAPSPEHVSHAAALVAELPGDLGETVRDPLGAVATVYCLLLNEDDEARGVQLRYLAEQADRRALEETQRIVPAARRVAPEARLPLAGMCLPALCNLSREQYQGFRDTVRHLCEADHTISLFEYALQHVVLRRLARRFDGVASPAVECDSLPTLLPACVRVVSTLAHARACDPAAAAWAFRQAAATLATAGGAIELLPCDQCGLVAFDEALDRLASATPRIKKQVLEACATCVGADGQVTVEEGELLRVIADALDCPMPPLLCRRA